MKRTATTVRSVIQGLAGDRGFWVLMRQINRENARARREYFTDEQFATLYGPWEPHIPAASLGSWDTVKGRVIT